MEVERRASSTLRWPINLGCLLLFPLPTLRAAYRPSLFLPVSPLSTPRAVYDTVHSTLLKGERLERLHIGADGGIPLLLYCNSLMGFRGGRSMGMLEGPKNDLKSMNGCMRYYIEGPGQVF